MAAVVLNPERAGEPSKPSAATATVVDEARFLLASIVASSDDAIISKTPTGIITSWNNGAEAIFGYTAREAIGRHISLLAVPGDDQDMSRIVERVMRGERIDHYETRRRAKNGEVLNISLTVSPIRDDSGEIIGASKIARNITARKKTQDALRSSEKLAVMGRMVASIAHEINNPLEAITNLLYLLQGQNLDPQSSLYIGQAQRELARVAAITAQTLKFYRNAILPVRIEISDILDETIEFHKLTLLRSNIHVERRYRPTPTILFREGEMRQVFMNLISNAVDAMPKGGRLSVRLREAAHPVTGEPIVRITVADTGMGMDGVTLKHLFEPFYTTKGAAGTGLGLWVSAEIVNKHQGRIQVRSSQKPGRMGTVFVLHLRPEAFVG
ncbi:MAG TPA: PAS domain S-box protein [Acidobacteriaceae bacterium]